VNQPEKGGRVKTTLLIAAESGSSLNPNEIQGGLGA